MNDIYKLVDEIYDNFSFYEDIEIEARNGWEASITHGVHEYSRRVFFKYSSSPDSIPTLVAKFSVFFSNKDDFQQFGLPDEVECKYAGEDIGFLDIEVLKTNRIRKNYKEMNEKIELNSIKAVKHKI